MVEKIDLSIPRHWNQCTTEQLEIIASVLQEQVQRVDRYHPFSMQSVKLAVFLVLTGIEIVSGPKPRIPVEEQFYRCRFLRKKRLGKKTDDDEFSIYLWQLNYWISPKAKTNDKTSVKFIAQGSGILDWLDNRNGIYLTRFPYPTLSRRRRLLGESKTFKGPLNDLDGFSWSQYRFASDTMQSYVQLSNNLVRMKEMGRFSNEQLEQQAKNANLARAMFLATIFNAKTDYVDTNTGIVKHDYHYESNQCTDNADYFRSISDTQWQVILFWWTGIMHTLSRRYPHVFKVQKIKKNAAPSTPLEIYTATTATMQKYAGLTEDQVNHQSYSLVLEHLERMSRESEELERMRKK